MATKLQQLRDKAKKLGITAKQIRAADRDELLSLIEDAEAHNGKPSKKAAKKAVKKAVAKKSTAKASSAKKSAPAKSRKSGPAKRQTAQKPKATASNGNGGRNTLGKVDFSKTDGWNPRSGTAPDRIVKALKKFKGNRQKVYEFLLPDIGDFVKNKKRDGSKWEPGEGQGSRKGMLKYRISRTAWQFALATSQHEASENRVAYGTGGTGQGIFKAQKSKAKSTPRKAAAKAPARKATPAKRKVSTAKRATRKPAARKATRKAARR